MFSAITQSALLATLRRWLAFACVALVGFLGMAGANADLHAQLHAGHAHDDHGHDHASHAHHGHTHDGAHGHEHDSTRAHSHSAQHDDSGCVIDLFAQGVEASVEQPRVVAAALVGESLYHTVAERATPTKPAGLLPPVCGPPLK